MATISQIVGSTTGFASPSRVHTPYVISQVVDLAAVLAAKGSALAASDIVNVLSVPAGAVVMSAGAQVLTAANSTTLTVSLGYSGSATTWVSAVSATTAGVLASTTTGASIQVAAADNISLTFAALTGTLTTGKILVWAELANTAVLA